MECIVSESYAKAIFELAKKENKVLSYRDQLKGITKTAEESQDLMDAIGYPWIRKQDKKSILSRVLSCDSYLMNMLYLLVDKNKFSCLKDIYVRYEAYANEFLGIESAEVTSAYPLTQSELERIKCLLEKKRGRKVELKVVIDPSYMAGLRVKIKDMVMENTASGRLDAIRKLASKADK